MINTVCRRSLGRRPGCEKDGIISRSASSKTLTNTLPRIAKNNLDAEVHSDVLLGDLVVSKPTDTEGKTDICHHLSESDSL